MVQGKFLFQSVFAGCCTEQSREPFGPLSVAVCIMYILSVSTVMRSSIFLISSFAL